MIKNLFSQKSPSSDPTDFPQNDAVIQDSNIDPEKYFLIIFLRSGQIYRTWIRKTDFDTFRDRFQNSRDTIGIKKRFFQFGRHDEFDLTEIA